MSPTSPALKEAFRDGEDIHALTAAQVFGVPVEGMDPMVRRRAKAINFGIIYGISRLRPRQPARHRRRARRAPTSTPISSAIPASAPIWSAPRQRRASSGYVTTLFGRRMPHRRHQATRTPRERSFSERAAINAPIQGGAADIIKRAMIRVPAALDKAKLEARMLLQVHDELLFEVPETEVDKTIATLCKAVMERAPVPAVELAVPLVVDAGHGDNWAEAH